MPCLLKNKEVNTMKRKEVEYDSSDESSLESLGDISDSDEDVQPEQDSESEDQNPKPDSEEVTAAGEKTKSDTNERWADAITKVLQTDKAKGKKYLTLSKSTLLCNKLKDKPKTEIDPVTGFAVTEVQKKTLNENQLKAKRLEWLSRGRVKPDILQQDKERSLARVAIKGVVQLFNAVEKHQKTVKRKLDEVGTSEYKRDKVIKSINKKSFLDLLSGNNSKSEIKEEEEVKSEDELKEEPTESQTWGVLREDFMMGTKLKDWDKEATSKEVES